MNYIKTGAGTVTRFLKGGAAPATGAVKPLSKPQSAAHGKPAADQRRYARSKIAPEINRYLIRSGRKSMFSGGVEGL
ncbi:MAG: hypothetical protein HY751_03025 [Nitrospinae bacterium]|nr:hypothetical protein [Nitrospinota bacterium]